MTEVVIIIGNGFDRDLGLPSSYSDFTKSQEWEAVVEKVSSFLHGKSYNRHSLIAHLKLASKDSQWFDIEEEIHKFVVNHPDNSDQEINDIKSEFFLIKNALTDYLKRVSKNFVPKEKRLSSELFEDLDRIYSSLRIINFNYTNPIVFLWRNGNKYRGNNITYVHGSLEENNIVLGCDIQKGEEVNRSLSFMYKYNQLYQANHIARELSNASNVVFFGHSINEMDFGYFRDFFKMASSSPRPIRHVAMITLDEMSERKIKDNIRNQGISVTDLFNNLGTFDFIRTKIRYEEGDKNTIESYKWYMLINRLKTVGYSGIKVKN